MISLSIIPRAVRFNCYSENFQFFMEFLVIWVLILETIRRVYYNELHLLETISKPITSLGYIPIGEFALFYSIAAFVAPSTPGGDFMKFVAFFYIIWGLERKKLLVVVVSYTVATTIIGMLLATGLVQKFGLPLPVRVCDDGDEEEEEFEVEELLVTDRAPSKGCHLTL